MVKTPNTDYCYFHMEKLYVDIYKFGIYAITIQHSDSKYLIFITLHSHFRLILLCNSYPNADDG